MFDPRAVSRYRPNGTDAEVWARIRAEARLADAGLVWKGEAR